MTPCPVCMQEGFDPQRNLCPSCGYGAPPPEESRGSWRGRMGRDAFWRGAVRLLGAAVGILLFAILAYEKLLFVKDGGSPAVWALSLVISLGAVAYGAGFVWMAVSAAVRRCRDLELSPWILLLGLTGVALPVLAIYLSAARGSSEPNAYGAACSLDGRIGRARYWGRTLAPVLVMVLLSMLVYLVPGFTPEAVGGAAPRQSLPVSVALTLVGALPVTLGVVASALLFVSLWWAAIAAGVKRCHDLGYPGWLVLLELIPYLGIIMVLWLGCVPGRKPAEAEAAPPPPAQAPPPPPL